MGADDSNTPDAGGNDQNQQPTAEQVQQGMQKRIDEITKQAHESKRQFDALMERHNEAVAMNAQLLSRIQQPQQEAEQVEIDPEEMRKIDFIVSRATAPLKAQIGQLTASLRGVSIGGELKEVQTKLTKLNKPEVTERTNQLLELWSDPRHPQHGLATPSDAYKIALAEAVEAQYLNAEQSNAEREVFNPAAQPLTGVHRSTTTPRGPAGDPIEHFNSLDTADIGNMTPQELDKLITSTEKASHTNNGTSRR